MLLETCITASPLQLQVSQNPPALSILRSLALHLGVFRLVADQFHLQVSDAMSANSSKNGSANVEVIPEDLSLEIRRLAHDLSNALEIIVQTSYLLSTAELKEPASAWLGMLDSGVTKCLDINLELRKFIKAHTAK